MEEKTVEKTAEKKNDSLLLWMKIQTGLLAAILVLLLAVGTVIGIQANKAMQAFRGVDMEKVNAIVLSVQNTAAQLESVDMDTINKAVDSLKGAAENLAAADVDAVNEGIQALTEAARNLQELDIDQMNELIKSLETVSKQMEKTTSAFSRIFG